MCFQRLGVTLVRLQIASTQCLIAVIVISANIVHSQINTVRGRLVFKYRFPIIEDICKCSVTTNGLSVSLF